MAIELDSILTNSDWGSEAGKINTNNQKLVSEIIKTQNSAPSIKWYSTGAELSLKRPNPGDGETAWAGTPYPGTARAASGGIWNDTGVVPNVGTVELNDYAKTTTVAGVVIRTGELTETLSKEKDKAPSNYAVDKIVEPFYTYPKTDFPAPILESSRYSSTGALLTEQSGFYSATFPYTAGETFYFTGRLNAASSQVAWYFDASGNPISREYPATGSNVNYVDLELHPPVGTATIGLTSRTVTLSVKKLTRVKNTVTPAEMETAINEALGEPDKPLGDHVLWAGTSIPNGCQYPQNICMHFGATINKVTVPSSACESRLNSADRKVEVFTYSNGSLNGKLGALSETIADKQFIVDNYAAIEPYITGSKPTVEQVANNTNYNGMGAADYIRYYSYEKRVIENLTDIDTFFFNHGYNDTNSVANQTLLTAIRLVNDRSQVGTPEYTTALTLVRDKRNFIGGAIQILDAVYAVNPKIKVYVVSEYSRYCKSSNGSTKTAIIDLQEELAKYYGIPFINLADNIGITDYIIPNTAQYWDIEPWLTYKGDNSGDMEKLRYLIPDGTHPFSDPNGLVDKLMEKSCIRQIQSK